jgi:Family of unknown function (DUF6231)
MAGDPRSAIARLLDELQPRTLLLLSPDPHGEWRRWCEQHCAAAITALSDAPLARLERLGRYDMALVIGLMERLDKTEGVQLIGRLRNVHTEHLFVLIGADARWPVTEWYALALQCADRFQVGAERLTLYGYDLASYNRTRSWNNPRYWANPENWGKYWW